MASCGLTMCACLVALCWMLFPRCVFWCGCVGVCVCLCVCVSVCVRARRVLCWPCVFALPSYAGIPLPGVLCCLYIFMLLICTCVAYSYSAYPYLACLHLCCLFVLSLFDLACLYLCCLSVLCLRRFLCCTFQFFGAGKAYVSSKDCNFDYKEYTFHFSIPPCVC